MLMKKDGVKVLEQNSPLKDISETAWPLPVKLLLIDLFSALKKMILFAIRASSFPYFFIF
mgnify:CR=1 FL=1